MTRAFGHFGGSHPFFTNKDHNIQNRRTKGKHAPEDSHTLALPHVLDRVLGHLDLRGFLRVGPRISRIQIHFFSEFRSCHDLCDGKFRLERRVRLGWSRRFLPANTVNIFLSVSGDPASLSADSQGTKGTKRNDLWTKFELCCSSRHANSLWNGEGEFWYACKSVAGNYIGNTLNFLIHFDKILKV